MGAPRKTPFGYQRHVWQIRVPALALQGTAAKILDGWTPGFAFEVEKLDYVVTVLHTCAGAGTRAFTLKRGTTAVAVITPTHATACAKAVGGIVAQTSLDTSVNKFAPTDTLSIDYITGTAFTAGEADIFVTVRELSQSVG